MSRRAAARQTPVGASVRSERTGRATKTVARSNDNPLSPAEGVPHLTLVAEEGGLDYSLSADASIDRARLQAEMIEMRERYRDGATEAATNIERFEQLSDKLKALLDEEFPNWESEPERQRSDMITLYFQYRGDMERAAAIQDKFERMTRDIETILNEEFPEWHGEQV